MWCNETFIYNSIAVKKRGFKYINETNICSKHNYKSESSVEEEMGNKMLKITFDYTPDYFLFDRQSNTYTLNTWNEVMPKLKLAPQKKYKKTEETIKKDNKRRAVKYYNDKYPFLNIDKDISDDKFQEIKDNIWNIKKVIKLLKFFKNLDLNEEKYNEYLQNLIE